MKISLLVLTVAVLGFLAVVSVSAAKPRWHELDQDYTFEQYTKDFLKRYPSAEEYAARKALFERKLKDIIRFNKEDHSWKKGVNHLTDKFDHELKRLRGVKKELLYANHEERIARPIPEDLTRSVEDLPDYIDWREKNIISDVKDQGDCGSCWTFATAESVESYWALVHGVLPVLSEQQVLDCTPNPQQCGGTGGCAGGTTEIAFTQIVNIGGLSSEWTYPYMSYHGRNFNCSFNSSLTPPAANITGYVGLPSNQYDPIMNAVVNGPLAISVDASSWGDYETGVFNGCNNTNPDIDHAVQLVGYGTDSVLGDYWLVRNSWSPAWGESGYIRIGRSSNVTCGTDLNPSDGTACAGGPPTVTVCGNCGILYDVTFPTVN